MEWLKLHKPDRLDCKVEKLMKDAGHEILWTPPYCPDLQPIELFWAAGKNHAGMLHYEKRSMKDTVKHLREGWYGSFGAVGEEDDKKRPVDCNKLYLTSIKYANTKFIPMCKDSLSGTIGALIQDPSYTPPTVDVPIDTLLLEWPSEQEQQPIEAPQDD
jgi:hypothetical protein